MQQSAIMNLPETNEKWKTWEKKYRIPAKKERRGRKDWKERKKKKNQMEIL